MITNHYKITKKSIKNPRISVPPPRISVQHRTLTLSLNHTIKKSHKSQKTQ